MTLTIFFNKIKVNTLVKQKTEQNLLELVPERMREFEKDEEGNIQIIYPKFTNRFLVKYLVPRLKQPYIKVQLDELGSTVWEACDGENTVEEIATILNNKFGKSVEPVYERLAMFFQNLHRLKFIRYLNYEAEKA